MNVNWFALLWIVVWVAVGVLLVVYPRMDITVALGLLGVSLSILATKFSSLF